MKTELIKNLKVGSIFSITSDGASFIRCRNGFRYGRGGELYKLKDFGMQLVFVH